MLDVKYEGWKNWKKREKMGEKWLTITRIRGGRVLKWVGLMLVFRVAVVAMGDADVALVGSLKRALLSLLLYSTSRMLYNANSSRANKPAEFVATLILRELHSNKSNREVLSARKIMS